MPSEQNVNVEKLSKDNEISNEDEEILPGYSSIEQFTKEGYKILMEAIRNSNSLPTGRDWSFYNTHEAFTKIIGNESNNILKQINYILRNNKVEGNISNRVLGEKTELMVEANDVILERVANNIDEMNGIKKSVVEPVLIQTVSAQLPINGSWNRINNATFSVSSSISSEPSTKSGNAIRLLTAKNIIRPQKFFKDKIINSCKYPWEPRIKEKPNSLKPLAIFLEQTENGEEYSHPYELELEKFMPLPEQLKKEKPFTPLRVENTPLVEINKPEQVEELVETLRHCKEFAVDLEHHSYRSFMGITCLMQISTREKDYLIDTLALRDKLYLLNEVFTKPTIVKIFHGADMDIRWLQRDLSVYVVNLFDTYQAAKQLGFSGLSLAYLMERFCNFVPNKQFQLADWRMRPLPDELKSYAREDTHYLIHIYHMLKNQLIINANGKDNLLLSVIKLSTETCKKRYFRPVLTDESHLDLYRKSKRLFDNRQLYALRELYKWRDEISREEDESTGYVLPNHMLLQISDALPREMQGILACCNPIPPLVRSNLLELHQIILRAKEQPLERPILKEDTRARGTTLKISKVNVDSPLHCPHDLTRASEFRDDLPTLLSDKSSDALKNLVNTNLEVENLQSTYSAFNTPENCEEEENKGEKKLRNFTFLSPFERYKLVKPFIKAEEDKLAAEKAKTDGIPTQEPVPKGKIIADTRTDEERIESIREHFLMLSRKTVMENKPESLDRPLIEMGGSRKRKRDSLFEDETDNMPTNLQTPVPNLNVSKGNQRKRKSSDMQNSPNKIRKAGENTLADQQNVEKLNKKLGKNQRKKLNRQMNRKRQQNIKGNQEEQLQNQNEQFDEGPSGNQIEEDRLQSEIGQGNNNSQSLEGNRSRNNRGRQRKRKQKVNPNQPQQNQDFTEFDYSTVDFRQFQGGAGGVQATREIKTAFKYKGKKRNTGRGQNKSSTFNSFGRGGKGRGR